MNFIGIKNIDHLIKLAEITTEMHNFFDKRTKRHIDLVKKYCKKIYEYDPERFEGIMDEAEDHDSSKWENPEVKPYHYTTWMYKCKDEGKKFDIPEDIKEEMNEATWHHVKHNKHHPEYWSDTKVNKLNINNRDKWDGEKAIDSTKMPPVHLACMVADWCGMSEEKGTDPFDWAKENINKRWKFSKEQENLIYELLENIWNKKEHK